MDRYSLPAAASFTFIYLLAFTFHVRSKVNRTQVGYSITFSCFVHLVSFILRIVLAYDKAVAPLSAAQDILVNTGFLFLLYPAYILILKLEKFTQATIHLTPSQLLNPLRIRPLFRLALLFGAILRIMATSHLHSTSQYNWAPETIYALNEASNIVFAVLVSIVVLLAVDYVKLSYWSIPHREYVPHSPTTSSSSSSGEHSPPVAEISPHTPFIVLFISLALLLRQVFAIATMYPPLPSSFPPQSSSPTQKPTPVPEHLWYILLATPELIAILLFSRPGLEPPHVYRVPELTEEDSHSESVSEPGA